MSRFRILFLFGACLLCACNRPPAGFYAVTSHDNIEYVKRGALSLHMDIFTPQGAPAPHPGILLYHGGGWVMGNRSDERALCKFLASMGYTTATSAYRLCSDSGPHYPVPNQDALAALKFFRAHAADYQIDPEKIAVGGESAGGQIALLVGLAKDPAIFKDDTLPGVSTHVSAIINIYGPADLTVLYDKGPWYIRSFGQSYLCGGPKQFADRYREASPVTHVRSDAPPVLTVQGDDDPVVPFEQAQILHDAILRAGGKSSLVRVPGAGHGWGLLFNENTNMRTLPAITQFLARVFPTTP